MGVKSHVKHDRENNTQIVNGSKMCIAIGIVAGKTSGGLCLVLQIQNEGMSLTAEIKFQDIATPFSHAVGIVSNAISCMMHDIEIKQLALAPMLAGAA